MIQIDRVQEFILSVITTLGEDQQDIIKEGMVIFAALVNDEMIISPNHNVSIQICHTLIAIPYSLWHEINLNSETHQIASIKKLRAWVKERHGYLPGLKGTKECVEDKRFFPGV